MAALITIASIFFAFIPVASCVIIDEVTHF